MSAPPHTAFVRSIVMISLIAAGEAVFALPFVLARVFRPTVLDAFGLTNLQLGDNLGVIRVPREPIGRWRPFPRVRWPTDPRRRVCCTTWA